MKKTLAAFLIFTAAVFLTAETGYRGVEWGMTEAQVKEKKPVKKGTVSLVTGQYLYETDIMLQDIVNINYLFIYGKLVAITYTVETEKEALLLQKINNSSKYKQLQANQFTVSDSAQLEATEENILNVSAITALASYGGAFKELEDEEHDEAGNAKMIFYNYNEDTSVVIYSNLVKDRTIVIYSAKHPQDF